MPKYYFYQVNIVFVGPNPDVPEDCAGAYVNCVVESPNRVTAIEILISDLKNIGFFYEDVGEVMDLEDAIKRFDLDPEHEDLKSSDAVAYGEFHCYPHSPNPGGVGEQKQ